MIESRSLRAKSRIAVMKGSSLEHKENIPCFAGRKGNTNQSGRRKTHANVLQSRQVVKSQTAKSAPNFEKLHSKWESKLAKRKATTKRPNTKVEPFNLTRTPQKNEDVGTNDNFLDDSGGKLTNYVNEDDVSPIRSSNKTPDDSAQDTFKDDRISSNTVRKTPKNVYEFKIPMSRTRQKPPLSVRKEREQNEQDLFEFQPDNAALTSILNYVGVDEVKTQVTPNSRCAVSLCSQSPSRQKRSSVYYTGPNPNRPLSGFGQRLMSRRASAMNANVKTTVVVATRSHKHFEPSRTLVGIQEMGSRFAITPQKELPVPEDCINYKACVNMNIPEETSEGITLSRGKPSNVCQLNGTNLNEVSWADTLKYYSQFSSNEGSTPEACNQPQDTDALIAQLEDEVYRDLSEVKLMDRNVNSVQGQQPSGTPYSSSRVTASREFAQNSNLHSSKCFYPLQIRREKTPLFRQLFASPSSDALDSNTGNCAASLGTKATFTKKIQKNPNKTNVARNNPFAEVEPTSYESAPEPFRAFQEYDTLQSGFGPPTNRLSNSLLFSKDMSNCLPVSDTTTNSSVYRNMSTSDSFNTAQTICGKKTSVPSTFPEANFMSRSISGFSKQRINEQSAFKSVRSFNTTTKNVLSMNAASVTSVRENTATKIVVPTPQRPVAGKILPRNKLNLHETGPTGFFTRHRQIMHDVILKSQEHAQEILLDAEVSLYARNIESILQKYGMNQRLENPLAKLFIEGDDMHFAPVNEYLEECH